MNERLAAIVEKIGLPRLIIGFFLAAFCVAAALVKLPMSMLASDMLVRFGMNAVSRPGDDPAIRAGTGLILVPWALSAG